MEIRTPDIVAKLPINSPTSLHRPRKNRYRFFVGLTPERAHYSIEKSILAVASHRQNRQSPSEQCHEFWRCTRTAKITGMVYMMDSRLDRMPDNSMQRTALRAVDDLGIQV